MKAVIVCSGSMSAYGCFQKYFDHAGLIICVDGGARHTMKMGVKPHVLLGDFDSISKEELEEYEKAGINIFRFPSEKDMTDSELAIEYALEKGCSELVLLGALGTRLDHSLSNIFLLEKIHQKGARGIIADELNELTLTDSGVTLEKGAGGYVSLLPISEKVTGVTTEGLYYPLAEAVLKRGSSFAVSNEFMAETAKVTIRSGLLLVVRSFEK